MSSPFKLVLRESLSLQHGRVYRVQNEIALRPRKVEEAETVYLSLILGRQRDSVDGALDVVSRQEAKCVARVDSQTAVEGLGPLPIARLVVLIRFVGWIIGKRRRGSSCMQTYLDL